MRQILYFSRSTAPVDQPMLDAILLRSRHNNALDGVTGMLWVNGNSFAQVIEGDSRAVGEAMDRITADTRHRDIVVLHDRAIHEREFGDWRMDARDVSRSGDDAYDMSFRAILSRVPDEIRAIFGGGTPAAAG